VERITAEEEAHCKDYGRGKVGRVQAPDTRIPTDCLTENGLAYRDMSIENGSCPNRSRSKASLPCLVFSA
jgi:hypothetical protein